MKNRVIFFVILVSKLAVANMNGSDIQSFNPAADNGDFVTVYSSKTLDKGSFNLGAFFDYGVNTLPSALDSGNQKYGANNTIISSDLHMALGLFNRWQLGLNVGSTLDTQVKPDNLKDYYKVRGVTDVRLSLKVNFYQRENFGLALFYQADMPQIENDYLYGKSNRPSHVAELIASMDLDQWSWAANAGYNLRQRGEKIAGGPYDPVGDMWIGSLAGAYRFAQTNWTVVAELFGAVPKEGTFNYSQDELSSLEGLVGAKYSASPALEWQGGMTTGFSKGVSSPDYRAYVGLNWRVDGLWGSKDESKTPSMPVAAAPITAPPVLTAQAPVEFPAMSNFIVSNMNFESGSSKVSDRYHTYLKKFVEFVNAKKSYKSVVIRGYTDDVGSDASNQKLSDDRAKAVRKILVQHGLDQNKVSAIGMGETNPIASNATPEGRHKNRRIEFIVEE